MNRFNKYNMTNISFQDIDNLINDYLEQVGNSYLKKVSIGIKNEDLEINIEPYYFESSKWNIFVKLIKNKNVNFWFRDDDAGIDDEGLEFLVNFMNELNVNLFIAAIPVKVSNYLATKLKKYSNISIGQHGFSHKNYSLVGQSEYPKDRNKDEVRNELIIGRKNLKDIFKDKFINIFIPPWFEIDEETKKILAQEKYGAISNYWDNNINKYNLIEANCQIDYVNWNKAYTFGGEDFVLMQLISELLKDKEIYNIGILLHHERMGKESYYFLNKLINVIKDNSSIISIKDLINSMGVQND